MTTPLLVRFVAGDTGSWQIDRVTTVIGGSLPAAARIAVLEGDAAAAAGAWMLRGVVSNLRYTSRQEVASLAEQQGLGRRAATRAALIPLRKSDAWWALAQDERREIMEEQSHHFAIGREYLPAIARRLHHCRDLGEPFDFLTWFEFAPAHESEFEALLERLRRSPEWAFIDREVDIRLSLG